ncbi:MAG: hypothetical protein MZV65_47935 [Chromatiales bacterium]|nr:hypothetical protein [Chromatiales bacterium]
MLADTPEGGAVDDGEALIDEMETADAEAGDSGVTTRGLAPPGASCRGREVRGRRQTVRRSGAGDRGPEPRRRRGHAVRGANRHQGNADEAGHAGQVPGAARRRRAE